MRFTTAKARLFFREESPAPYRSLKRSIGSMSEYTISDPAAGEQGRVEREAFCMLLAAKGSSTENAARSPFRRSQPRKVHRLQLERLCSDQRVCWAGAGFDVSPPAAPEIRRQDDRQPGTLDRDLNRCQRRSGAQVGERPRTCRARPGRKPLRVSVDGRSRSEPGDRGPKPPKKTRATEASQDAATQPARTVLQEPDVMTGLKA